MIFGRVSKTSSGRSQLITHNPGHGKPHAKPSPEFLANEKSQDTPREGS
jgi:hypothetical protein